MFFLLVPIILDLIIIFIGLALNQILLDPLPDFLHNVIDDGPVAIIVNDGLDLVRDGKDVVTGEAGDGLDVILEWRLGVVRGELEAEFDLVLCCGLVGSSVEEGADG